LAELVKIDPEIDWCRAVPDVDQKLLKKKLDETVESVYYVGVDLNTASIELLAFVSALPKHC